MAVSADLLLGGEEACAVSSALSAGSSSPFHGVPYPRLPLQLITALTSGKWGLDSLDIRYDHITYKIDYNGPRVRDIQHFLCLP